MSVYLLTQLIVKLEHRWKECQAANLAAKTSQASSSWEISCLLKREPIWTIYFRMIHLSKKKKKKERKKNTSNASLNFLSISRNDVFWTYNQNPDLPLTLKKLNPIDKMLWLSHKLKVSFTAPWMQSRILVVAALYAPQWPRLPSCDSSAARNCCVSLSQRKLG